MPELPEVETTVRGLRRTVCGRTFQDVWSDLPQKNHSRKDEIKNLTFWNFFRKNIRGARIESIDRHGKNIFIHLSNGFTVLVHMKMTGHLMHGTYRRAKKTDGEPRHSWVWWSETKPLQDPYNRFIHVLFTFTDGTHLAFCDSRKFGKITLFQTQEKTEKHKEKLGIDALDIRVTFSLFQNLLLKKPDGRIKNTLMDQSLIAGIGNIYSDEMLWLAGIHPEERVRNIPQNKFKLLFGSMKPLLRRGINFGGDSTSDYRNISGERGAFHEKHNVYRKTGSLCTKKGCSGVILRKVVGGRSAHFCSIHQKKLAN